MATLDVDHVATIWSASSTYGPRVRRIVRDCYLLSSLAIIGRNDKASAMRRVLIRSVSKGGVNSEEKPRLWGGASYVLRGRGKTTDPAELHFLPNCVRRIDLTQSLSFSSRFDEVDQIALMADATCFAIIYSSLVGMTKTPTWLSGPEIL